ncbi:MAG: PAS domain S-box protein, partial [Rhodospirillaceae bacterium]|nr:PAS domain S-box protein [Rhodospirillaceae bacterium]
MQAPKDPLNEAERLMELCDLSILDTPPEARFDRFTRIAQEHFKVPIAVVSLVDQSRQWFKSIQGLDATETPREISFCGHAILGDEVFYVPNTLEDPKFADNPLVTGPPHIRFYAGAPLSTPNGLKIGTLCIIDTVARTLSDHEFGILRDLADCVEQEIGHGRLLGFSIDLETEKARLGAVLNTVVEGIVTIDAQGVIETFNPAAEHIFGYTASEVIGRNVKILMPEPYHGEHDGYLHSYVKTGDAKVIGIGREVIGQRKDGSTFPMELAVSEMAVAGERMFTGIVRDITARKQAEAELRDRESRVRAIVDTVVDGIVTIDAKGVIETFNPAAERIFGYPASEVIGRNVKILMPEPYHGEHDGYLHSYVKTGDAKVIGIGREV